MVIVSFLYQVLPLLLQHVHGYFEMFITDIIKNLFILYFLTDLTSSITGAINLMCVSIFHHGINIV